MKKFLLGLMVVSAVATAHADDELEQKKAELCALLASSAERNMEAHQIGVPLSKMLSTVTRNNTKPLEWFGRDTTFQAYSSPRYTTEEYQKRAIEEFRDKRHLDCLKIVSKY